MSDYCYHSHGGGCCGEASDSHTIVRLNFLRSELLYDIKNYAYIEAHVMGEEKQHAQHVLADIGESGNVDRVSRVLAVVHAAVIEMLYPYTKRPLADEELSDSLFEPDNYPVTLRVPSTMSRTTVRLLSRLIHEYMVYCVLADWLSVANPDASLNWSVKAESVKKEIEEVKNLRRGVLTRKTHPW